MFQHTSYPNLNENFPAIIYEVISNEKIVLWRQLEHKKMSRPQKEVDRRPKKTRWTYMNTDHWRRERGKGGLYPKINVICKIIFDESISKIKLGRYISAICPFNLGC